MNMVRDCSYDPSQEIRTLQSISELCQLQHVLSQSLVISFWLLQFAAGVALHLPHQEQGQRKHPASLLLSHRCSRGPCKHHAASAMSAGIAGNGRTLLPGQVCGSSKLNFKWLFQLTFKCLAWQSPVLFGDYAIFRDPRVTFFFAQLNPISVWQPCAPAAPRGSPAAAAPAGCHAQGQPAKASSHSHSSKSQGLEWLWWKYFILDCPNELIKSAWVFSLVTLLFSNSSSPLISWVTLTWFPSRFVCVCLALRDKGL